MHLSSEDLAAAFRVSTRAVQKWEKDGKIPRASRTVGRHRRWTPEEIAPLLIERGYPVPASWASAVAA